MANRLIALQAEKVIVADDHPLFRTAIKEALQESQGETTFLEASSFETLQELVDENQDVDLVLLDLHMPGALGFSALSWFIGHKPNTPVIMVSANSHPETVRRAIDHGAAGFLSKSTGVEDMEACISQVMAGERGLHPGRDAHATGSGRYAAGHGPRPDTTDHGHGGGESPPSGRRA